ncbi:MAG: site-specific integrase [Flavobacteriales bacterium]|nr:site-specific integrase [Flavobacteriales bacterium]
MARKSIFFDDKRNTYVGEFPRDALVGFEKDRRGIRRTLCKQRDLVGLTEIQINQHLSNLYSIKQQEFSNEKSHKEAAKKQAKRQKKTYTIRQANKLWMAEMKVTRAKKTVGQYQNTIDYYLDANGNHVVNDFTLDHSTEFWNHLQTREKQGGGFFSLENQATHIRKFNTFLNWCYDHEIMDRMHRLKRPKVPKRDMQTYDVEELLRLGQHIQTKIIETTDTARKRGYINIFRAFMLATNTALRLGPIWALKIDNIELDKRLVQIRDNKELDWQNKGVKWPDKPINEDLYNFLVKDLALRDPQERYFLDNGKGKPWRADRSDISKWMSTLCQDIGLAKIKPFHWGMRATIITELLTRGVDVHAVQKLADHESIETTMLYFNDRKVQQRRASDAILNAFSGVENVTKMSHVPEKNTPH